MTSIFTRFDLYIYYWSFFPLLIFLYWCFCSFSKINTFKNLVQDTSLFLGSFFISLKNKNFSKWRWNLFFCSFILVFFINFLSIFPYFFAYTSQPRIVLFLGLGLWISLIIYQISYNLRYFISHLIPEGSPLGLALFLFLIELVRNSIRPLTLTIRLTANILAGHLLIVLLYSFVRNFRFFSFLYVGLNLVELVVGLIQAYIFATLSCLYYSEVA